MTPYRIAFSVIVDAEGIDKGDAVNRAKTALGWSNPPLHVARALTPDIVVSASLFSVTTVMSRPITEDD